MMEQMEIQAMIDRYKSELMKTAARRPVQRRPETPPPQPEAPKASQSQREASSLAPEAVAALAPAPSLPDVPAPLSPAAPVREAPMTPVPDPPKMLPDSPSSPAPARSDSPKAPGPSLRGIPGENGVPTPRNAALPAPDTDQEINPPEAGGIQDPLQPTIPDEEITYEEFLRQNQKTGVLRVQVYAGMRAVPIPGAQVRVTKNFLDGEREFAAGVTDENGVLDGMELPAPDKELSQSPTGEAPYATYRIRVSHPDYRTEIYQEVPIFDGIKSIQPVRFIPDRLGS